MPSELELQRPRSFGDLISDTFTYARAHYRSLGKSLLYFVVPVLILTSFSTYSYMEITFEQVAMQTGENITGPDFSTMLLPLLGLIIFSLLSSSMLSAVVFNHMAFVRERGSGRVGTTELWNKVKKDFLILALLSVTVGSIVFMGFLFLFIPGIYLFVKLALVPAVYVTERTDFSETFSRSWNLTNGYWWKTFGLIFAINMLVGFISYLFIVPIYMILMFVNLSGAATDPTALTQGISIAYSLFIVISYGLYAFPMITIGLHYFNLTERKEGIALKEKIERIGRGPGMETL